MKNIYKYKNFWIQYRLENFRDFVADRLYRQWGMPTIERSVFDKLIEDLLSTFEDLKDVTQEDIDTAFIMLQQ